MCVGVGWGTVGWGVGCYLFSSLSSIRERIEKLWISVSCTRNGNSVRPIMTKISKFSINCSRMTPLVQVTLGPGTRR